MNSDLDTYHDYTKISRIFIFVDILAWLFLGISVVVVVLFLSRSIPPLLDFFDRDGLLNLLATLPQLLQGAFYFAILMTIKEAVYAVLDVEDNTRPKNTAAAVSTMAAVIEEIDDFDEIDEEVMDEEE